MKEEQKEVLRESLGGESLEPVKPVKVIMEDETSLMNTQKIEENFK